MSFARNPNFRRDKACLSEYCHTGSGCGAAWLARLLGVQEVPSSNLGGPTKEFKDLQTAVAADVLFWRPTGVQNPAFYVVTMGRLFFDVAHVRLS